MSPVRLVVGCMTGTSLDALDVALVRIAGEGLDIAATILRTHSAPLGPLAAPLRAMAEQQPLPARIIAAVARDLAILHVDAIAKLLASAAPLDRADLIAVHGQTVFHAPPLSWQLIDAAPIARAFKTPVVTDLRAADLAAGGQGAPITPLSDYILFRSREERLIVNLGGFCNVTLLPSTSESPGADLPRITGRDVCPCNHLLDAIARRCLNEPFDEDGRVASAGTPREEPLRDLRKHFRALARNHRSLGTGDEVVQWLNRYAPQMPTPDLAATACRAIAEAIVATLPPPPLEPPPPEPVYPVAPHILLAGGSVRNAALVGEIRDAHHGSVTVTDDLGVPAAYREAAAMAILGALCQDRVPITLPQITGVPAPAPVAGVWTFC